MSINVTIASSLKLSYVSSSYGIPESLNIRNSRRTCYSMNSGRECRCTVYGVVLLVQYISVDNKYREYNMQTQKLKLGKRYI